MKTEKSGSIVILSGPVGAGKTALAKAFIEISPAPLACIEGDEFWKFIVKEEAEKGPHRAFRAIMSSMTAASVPLAVAGYNVVLDFSIPPWYLENVLKITARREIPVHYVVLLPSQDVCAARATHRPDGTVGEYAPYEELYRDFMEAEQYTICDDDADPKALAEKVQEGLAAGRFLVRA